MTTQNLQQVKVQDIVPSPDNARKIDEQSQGFRDLVNSIKAGGVRVPIHVRVHPTKKGKYEIRAGERRWRACKVLKLEMMPAIVHGRIADAEALDLTYIENKFREDLSPLEEAAEVAHCLKRLGANAKLIAEKLGQTEQWVRLRANIHKNLSREWRNAFENLHQDRYAKFKSWTIGHLTVIARLPAIAQRDLFESFKWGAGALTVSVRELKEKVAGVLKLLSKAQWNLEDETLVPKAGACSKCLKRSGAQPILWFGDTVGDQIKAKDRCLDAHCWQNKMLTYLKRQAKKLSEEHKQLIYLATDYPNYDEKEKLSKSFGRIHDPYEIEKSTKTARGSVPALVVHGKNAGNVVYVKETKKSRPGRRAATGKPTPLKERRALLKAKRWSQVLIELREKVEAAGVDRVVYKDKTTAVMALVAIYGNEAAWGANVATCQKEIKRLLEQKRKHPTDAYSEALISLWNSFKPTLDRILTYAGPVTQTPQHVIEEARWIARLVQVDLDALFKQVSEQKGFTEPKSWKNLNPDGTPKGAKKTKKKKSA